MTAAVRTAVMRSAPAVVLLVAFAVLYATTLSSYGMLMWDEAEYASIGRSVLHGEGFAISGRPNALRPPVLPLAAAASMLLSRRQTDVIVKLPSVGFALLALWIIYAGTARHFDRTTGLAAAFCLGVLPEFWTMTARVLSEMPFMAFFSGAVLCFHSGLHRQPRDFLWSGLCFALALLSRYTALVFLPVAAGLTLTAIPWRHAEVWKRLWSRQFFLTPLVALVVLAPWFVRQQLTFGDALIGVKQSATQLQVYAPGVSMPWSFYLTNLPQMMSVPLMSLAAFGIGWSVWRRDRLAIDCVLVVALILIWFSVYRYKEVRLVTSILPFLAVLAAVGLTQGLLGGRLRRYAPRLVAAALSGVLVMNFMATRRTFAHVITNGYPSFLGAMRFLREHTWNETLLIGANLPQIVWYTDRRVVDFPAESDLLQLLGQADWVVATSFERGQQPYVWPLVMQLAKQRLQPGDVAVFQDGRFATVVIRSAILRERLAHR